ncbi:MAG: hypothetical protein B6I36_02495 [Desulfobacteraceae bacterium 4572_35.1]|nr:MAG: hypothetical protein B6I36_02495 [Desulfobacteraceae bacterium 4572_35.1]
MTILNLFKKVCLLLIFSLFGINGCVHINSASVPLAPVRGDYLQELAKFREAKDLYFQTDNSPLEEKQRAGFSGLCYYPPAADFRVVGLLEKYKKPELRIAGSESGQKRMVALGLFRFTLAGKDQVLEVWQTEEGTELSILFTDKTNGKETYGAGRYVSLEINDNKYILDFNYSYNPYCHYSHHFICPLPPSINNMDLQIEAGEKVYPVFESIL